MTGIPFRRGRKKVSTRDDDRTMHRLVRDVTEAEEIAVDWLRSLGFDDVGRIDQEHPSGLRGTGIVADVSFDPLPMEREVLQALVQDSKEQVGAFVSFAFAGWDPESLAWAEAHAIPLVRFTFAGTLEPSNDPARRLRAR